MWIAERGDLPVIASITAIFANTDTVIDTIYSVLLFCTKRLYKRICRHYNKPAAVVFRSGFVYFGGITSEKDTKTTPVAVILWKRTVDLIQFALGINLRCVHYFTSYSSQVMLEM